MGSRLTINLSQKCEKSYEKQGHCFKIARKISKVRGSYDFFL